MIESFLDIFLPGETMERPIGIHDSGVGGLSVVSKIREYLPNEEILYFGDTANVPYGDKSPEEVKRLVFRILNFFISKNVKAVVMACNSSSALVLDEALKKYDIPIIGVIEPAIKEALKVSPGKKIGLIANLVTVTSGAHQRAMTKISGNGVRVIPQACPKLVPLVEQGKLNGNTTESILKEYLTPLETNGMDTLILGCTHYPFLEKPIRKILKNQVKIVDPATLTAITLGNTLKERNILRNSNGKPLNQYFVSGDSESFREVGSMLLGSQIEEVKSINI